MDNLVTVSLMLEMALNFIPRPARYGRYCPTLYLDAATRIVPEVTNRIFITWIIGSRLVISFYGVHYLPGIFHRKRRVHRYRHHITVYLFRDR